MNYTVCMGYTNDFDKALNVVRNIKPFYKNLIIIDNSLCKDFAYYDGLPEGVLVYLTNVQLSASQTFNLMQKLARRDNSDILISLHSDIQVSDGFCNRFIDYLERLEGEKWGVALTEHDVVAAYNMDAVDVTGEWDDRIPQYPADDDYFRRLQLFGYKQLNFPKYENEIIHLGSSTINKDYVMHYINDVFTVQKCRDYYNFKWGNNNYRVAFNGKDIERLFYQLVSKEVYNELMDAYYTPEGGFLQNTDEGTRIAQFTFVRNLIRAIKPVTILQTGTHKSFFIYFLTSLLEKFKVFTFDNNPLTEKGVEIIQKWFPNVKVVNHIGDSLITMNRFEPPCQIDFAFVDGCHTTEHCYNDLKNAVRFGINNILVDDTKCMPTVNVAVLKFLEDYPDYYFIENPLNDMDKRGMGLLRKKRDKNGKRHNIDISA